MMPTCLIFLYLFESIYTRKKLYNMFVNGSAPTISCGLQLVLVVQNIDRLAIFDLLGALLQFQLQQRVGHDADTDIDRSNIVLHGRDGPLDIL